MKESWQRNLIVLWFGTFMTGIGSSLIATFISLYISTLGHYSKTELNIWSGLVFSSTFIVLAIVSPLWGRLADQKGRKLMLLRASLGMAISISLMAFVTAAWQLLILRMLLGAFSGFVSNGQFCTKGKIRGRLIAPYNRICCWNSYRSNHWRNTC